MFAVRLGEDLYGFIGRFQGFAGQGKKASELAQELFDAYRSNKDTQARMGDPLVTLFEQSDSFAEAVRNIGYLEDLAVWKPSYGSRVEAALKANGQVNGSWGVPARVKTLSVKWGAAQKKIEADDDEIPF